MPYFYISNGRCGCYAPDSERIMRADTRRELKNAIEYDAREMLNTFGHGDSARDRAAIVARAWRDATRKERDLWKEYVIGFGWNRARSDRPFGISISHATRESYLVQQED